jgi:hypothetical protein
MPTPGTFGEKTGRNVEVTGLVGKRAPNDVEHSSPGQESLRL